MIRIIDSTQVGKLLSRKAARFADAEETVRPILDAVRKRGDRALLEYARKFDNFDRKSPRVSAAELQQAESQLAPSFLKAVDLASKNIRAFAKLQMPATKSAMIAPGLLVGQVVRPLDTVAAYVPAGRYPLPGCCLRAGGCLFAGRRQFPGCCPPLGCRCPVRGPAARRSPTLGPCRSPVRCWLVPG